MAPGLITRGTITALVIAAVGATSATYLIHATARETASTVATPLPVAVEAYHLQPTYERSARHTGVVRAGNDSNLGFEVPGTLLTTAAREGDPVRSGDIIATLDTAQSMASLEAASAEVARLSAELELAVLQHERLVDLAGKGLAAQQQLDEAQLRRKALVAAVDAARANLRRATITVEKSTLKAPFNGVIAERYLQRGTVVPAGQPVVRLIGSDRLEVHVGLPPEVAEQLQPGTTYSLNLRDRTVSATLRAIRSSLDSATLTSAAVFDLAPDADARPGDSASLEWREAVPGPGGWLPLSALTEGDRGLWNVLVLDTSDTPATTARETVEVIYSAGERVFVRGTLADGAQVVATGLHRLSPGSAVTPAEPGKP